MLTQEQENLYPNFSLNITGGIKALPVSGNNPYDETTAKSGPSGSTTAQ